LFEYLKQKEKNKKRRTKTQVFQRFSRIFRKKTYRKLTNTETKMQTKIWFLSDLWKGTRLLLENSVEAVSCCSSGWSWHVLSWRYNKQEMLDIACSKPRAELQDHRQHITWKAGFVR